MLKMRPAPCELLEIADSMEGSFPLGSIFGEVLLAELASLLHPTGTQVRLARFLLWGIALVCQPPGDELPGDFAFQM